MKEGFKAYPGLAPYLKSFAEDNEKASPEVRSLKGLRTASLLGIIMLFASLV